jgi:hypothetical protein
MYSNRISAFASHAHLPKGEYTFATQFALSYFLSLFWQTRNGMDITFLTFTAQKYAIKT